MKSIKLLIIAVGTIAISALYSCAGGNNDEALDDSTKVSGDQVIEQTIDSTASDTLKK